jgi:putative ABC transport system permease protein
MTWLRVFIARLTGLFRKDRLEEELNEELRAHLEMLVEENLGKGMSPKEARNAALRSFGGVEQVKEGYREQRGLPLIETFIQDLRYALRQLRRNPGFTAVAVLTLALGIGANTAIFSVVYATLFRLLPFKDPGRLVYVWSAEKARGIPQSTVSVPDFLDWRRENRVFAGLAARSGGNFNLSGGTEPFEVRGLYVTADFFSVLGVQPILGRTFSPDEEVWGKNGVVILSHRLWTRAFGRDPAVLNRQVTLDAQSYTVIGVMPAAFSSPEPDVELWVPLSPPPGVPLGRDQRFLRVIARLEPGVTFERAQSDMNTLTRSLEQSYKEDQGVTAYLVPIEEQLLGKVRPALLALLGAVGFVMLIACVNLVNLLLARAATREKEFAIRRALGASRARVFRQSLTESLVLSLSGGVLGVGLANWGLGPLRTLVADEIPRAQDIGLQAGVLWFALGLVLVTGIVLGLIPALASFRTQPNQIIKEGGWSPGTSARGGRLRDILVVAEAALALVLLVGAGLLLSSFRHLLEVNPGFDPERVLTFEVSLPSTKYRENSPRVSFFAQLLEHVRVLPGVKSTGATLTLPLGGGGRYWMNFEIEGNPQPENRQFLPIVNFVEVTPGYFSAMGIPMLKGRPIADADAENRPLVAVINATLARRFFSDADPIRKRIRMGSGPESPWLTIVGVCGDTVDSHLADEKFPQVYSPYAQAVQGAASDMVVAVRTGSDPSALAAAVREQVRALDKDQSVADMQTMRSVVGESLTVPRLDTLLVAAFASLALLLAAIGIYGLLSYAVAQHTKDIGIRMALGAERRDVLNLVVGRGLRLTLMGVAIGIVSALGLTRFLSSLLYGVEPTDPLTFVAVSLILTAVALAASYIPARRAAKVDPMVALRCE